MPTDTGDRLGSFLGANDVPEFSSGNLLEQRWSGRLLSGKKYCLVLTDQTALI